MCRVFHNSVYCVYCLFDDEIMLPFKRRFNIQSDQLFRYAMVTNCNIFENA